jgi:Trk-type K+ transport system membrane component
MTGQAVSVVALGCLILDFGFHLTDEQLAVTGQASRIVLFVFAGTALGAFLLSPEKQGYVRSHVVDAVILGFALLVLLVPGAVDALALHVFGLSDAEQLSNIYLGTTQAFVLLSVLPGALRASRRLMTRSTNPSAVILVSFVSMMLAGCGLLPKARVGPALTAVDALFMSASAVSVTGLAVVDPATVFSPMGHVILLVLIQAGGIGVMTITTFFATALTGSSGLRQAVSMESFLADSALGKIRTTAGRVIVVSFAIEAVGAAILYKYMPEDFAPAGKRFFFACFHSISAFCNAGFALRPANLADPVVNENVAVLSTVMVLITLGGIGFPVLSSLWVVARARMSGVRLPLNLHSRLVLLTSALLVVAGTVCLFLLESGGSMRGAPQEVRLLHSLFLSVSARTAGFNSMEMSVFSSASLLFVVFLMWVGASPASTGGGVKTTTFALALLNLRSIAAGRGKVELFRREVSPLSLQRAFSAMLLSILVIGGSSFLMLLLEPHSFEKLLFEVVSAISTVGLSTGITSALGTPAKLLLTALMLIGRAGLLGTLMAVVPLEEPKHYDLPDEEVLVS